MFELSFEYDLLLISNVLPIYLTIFVLKQEFYRFMQGHNKLTWHIIVRIYGHWGMSKRI